MYATLDNKQLQPSTMAIKLMLTLRDIHIKLCLKLRAYTPVCDCATCTSMVCIQCLDRGASTVRLLQNSHVYFHNLSASGACDYVFD